MEENRRKELEENFIDMMERRLQILGYCTEEEVIELMEFLIEVLFSEFPDAREKGIKLSHNWKTNELAIKSYPAEIFPKAVAGGEAEKLAAKMKNLKCCRTTFKRVGNFWKDTLYVKGKYSVDSKYAEFYLEIETL